MGLRFGFDGGKCDGKLPDYYRLPDNPTPGARNVYGHRISNL